MKDLVITALRQIARSAREGIWDAHRGCAAIAGALLIRNELICDAARNPLELHIRSLLGCEDEPPCVTSTLLHSSFTRTLLQELGVSAQEPKEIGHDVIYTAYVLRALDVFRIDPWEELLEGLTDLIRKIKASGPGWITVNGRKERRQFSPVAAAAGELDYWAEFVQLDRPRSMEAGDMQLGHLLTHGHAIQMLRGYGTGRLLEDLDVAYRKRLHSLSLANREERDRTPLRQEAIDPRFVEYWSRTRVLGDMHGHIVKYAYSFLDLKRGMISTQDLEAFGRIVWPERPVSVFE